ncbi:MAG: thiamine phosphate synthase [Vicinamibacterales bacterium]
MIPRTPLYAVVDEAVTSAYGASVTDVARRLLAGGARLLQVRAKLAASGAFLDWCDAVVALGRATDATIIVNDRADVAAMAGAAGVHVGQDDVPPAALRRWLGPEMVVGLSTHTPAQVDAALAEPVSYVAVGPIFPTKTKATGYAPVGLSLVRYAAERAGPIPVVAIGGITLERAQEVIDAGASSVVAISDLLLTSDPEARVREYLEVLRPRIV